MQPAQILTDLYRTVNPDESLNPDDPRYVDLSPARGKEDLAALITRRVSNVVSPYYHRRLITGHRGSGKSTELHRLQACLEEAGLLVAYLDVETTLDLADLEYLDVLLAIAYQLDKVAREHDLKVKNDLLKDVGNWFAEIMLTKEQRRETEIGLETEYGVGVEVPLLARMLASVTGQIRSGSSARKEIRQRVEQRLEDLIARLTLLVNEVTFRAQKKGFQGLVVIVDSMEKMPLKPVNEQGLTNQSLLFVEHAEQLKALPCHLIATVPVSLLNDRNLGIAFTDIDLIPMVKIAEADQTPWQPGRDLLFRSVSQRGDVGKLFSDPQVVYTLIEASGGVMRDLMRLLLFAADYAPAQGKITAEAAGQAIRKLVREYDRLIHQDDLAVMQAVMNNPHLPSSATLARLMYNRMVLPFINDDNWVSLHPAARAASTFRAALDVEVEE